MLQTRQQSAVHQYVRDARACKAQVEAACTEALEAGIASGDVILTVLARNTPSSTRWSRMMELRGPFDGFVEKAVRASTTCLIMADHNRYKPAGLGLGRDE